MTSRKSLAHNVQEAYKAAIDGGLSDVAAKALVANMMGKFLGNPRDSHWDVKHNSQGIVQWDPERSAAIRNHFGKYPKDMTVAEQTRAAIWEMGHNPSYAKSNEAIKTSTHAEQIIEGSSRTTKGQRTRTRKSKSVYGIWQACQAWSLDVT